jgi:hypothetical protein
MTSVSTPTLPATRHLLRFLRTPKGLTLIIFIGLVAVSSLKLGGDVATSRVIVAAVTAAAIDIAVIYWRRGQWILPDGAVLTGMIVALVLRPQESWLVLVVTVAVAILSKHALRTHWSNILNPAAFALVAAAIVLHTGQSWWGALPDLGVIGALVLLVAGGFIADRLNKLPMILAFFGAYFTLFAVASIFRSATVAETFLTPDLQAALFFAFFMLDDPPTSPVRHEDQIVFGIVVAVVAYFVFMQFGGVYFLPAGLLAGNLWESGRRLVLDRNRTRGIAAVGVQGRRRLRVAGLGTAIFAVPLVFASSIFATSGPSVEGSADSSLASGPSPTGVGATVLAPSVVPGTPNPYPFVPSFQSDLKGTYTQTNDAASGHLVLDGLATGDISLGVHVELLQLFIVPTPDDESVEATPDDEAFEAQPEVTTTINSAQLLDPTSKGLLCDGQLTGLNGGMMQFSCDGKAAYIGVQMQIASQLNGAADGTFSGALSGTMQRTS